MLSSPVSSVSAENREGRGILSQNGKQNFSIYGCLLIYLLIYLSGIDPIFRIDQLSKPWLRLRLRHTNTVCHFGSASGCVALRNGSRNTITVTPWPQATWTYDEELSLDNLSAVCIQNQAVHLITMTSNLKHISPSPCSFSS